MLPSRRCAHTNCTSRALRKKPTPCAYCNKPFCHRHFLPQRHDCSKAPPPPIACPACGMEICVRKGEDADEAVLWHVESDCRGINRTDPPQNPKKRGRGSNDDVGMEEGEKEVGNAPLRRSKRRRSVRNGDNTETEVLKSLQKDSVSALLSAVAKAGKKKKGKLARREKEMKVEQNKEDDEKKRMGRVEEEEDKDVNQDDGIYIPDEDEDGDGDEDDVDFVMPNEAKPAKKHKRAEKRKLVEVSDQEDSDEDKMEWEDGQNNVPSSSTDGAAESSAEKKAKDKAKDRKVNKVSAKEVKQRRAHLFAIARMRSLEAHKFHLILLLTMLRRMDAAANNAYFQSLYLSLIPLDIFPSQSCSKMQSVRRFSLWFPQFCRPVSETTEDRFCNINERCLKSIKKGRGTILDLTVIAAAMLRAIGIPTRIITPMQPIPYKPKVNEVQITQRKRRKGGSSSSDGGDDDGSVDISKMSDLELANAIPIGALHRLAPFYAWLEVCVNRRWTHLDPFYGIVDEPWPAVITRRLRSSTLDLMAKKSITLMGSPNDVKKTGMEEPVRTPAPPGAENNKKGKDVKEPGLVAHVAAALNGGFVDVSRRYAALWKNIEAARAPKNMYIDLLSRIGPSTEAEEELYDKETQRDLAQAELNEKAEFDSLEADEGIPKTQTALKNHPRYVLEKHLLKYEFIHPREPELGKVANSIVFPRANVRTLHTKDRWYREMRIVPEDATPLKWVNSRSQGQQVKVPLYGEWQTTELVIPPAINGIVPKTERNQVELWTDKHLPLGTVHVQKKYAAKVAAKLQIDYAPAMLGFEVRGSRSIPIIDGVVVCREFRKQVEDGCVEMTRRMEEIAAQKAKEEARKYWRQLLRALKAKIRVKKKYGGLIGADGTYQDMKKTAKGNIGNLVEKSNGDTEDLENTKAENENVYVEGTTKPHGHIFGQEVQVNEDIWKKKCKICDFAIEFEKL